MRPDCRHPEPIKQWIDSLFSIRRPQLCTYKATAPGAPGLYGKIAKRAAMHGWLQI
jgi:hypothetical protein